MNRYFILLLVLCLSLAVNAQIDRSKAPASGPTPQIHIGEYQSFTLDNGLKVLVVENNKIPQVTFSLNVVRDEILEKDKAGYVELAGELWGKATQKRNNKQLDEEVDFIGANLHTSATGASIGGLSKYTDQMLDIFSDVILNPSFPKEEFDKLVLQTKTALKANETDPKYILNNISSASIFGDKHPYGNITTVNTIDNISVDDCKTYYNDFVFPNNSVLVIVGDITLPKAKQLAGKYFSSWKKGVPPSFKYEAPHQPKGKEVVFSNKDAATQASIAVAYPVDFKRGAQDEIAVKVMNQILGGGGFQAKLFKNLRETKGYTYGAYSGISTDILDGAGKFNASAEVRANIADSAFMEIFKEMQNMIKADFTKEDIELVKKTMAGAFSRSLESPSTIANFAYSIERYNLPKDYYSTYLDRLSKITKEDAVAAAKKYIHPENAYLFVVGDRSLKPKLEKLDADGIITELDATGKILQQETVVSANITADQVIDKYLNAIGGTNKLKAIKDMSISSEMNIQNMKINNNYYYLIEPEKPAFMMTVSMAGTIMQKIVFDGEKAMISGSGGSQTIEGEKAAELKKQAYPFLELEYKNLNIIPTVEGVEKVNEKDAYKLKTVLGEAITYTFYDTESGLKVKAVGTQNGISQEATFEDYRPTESGLIYPFLSKSSMQGMPIEIKVTDIKTNTGLKIADFK